MLVLNVPPEPPGDVPVLIAQTTQTTRTTEGRRHGNVVMQDLTPLFPLNPVDSNSKCTTA
jgi:hypothetical protein